MPCRSRVWFARRVTATRSSRRPRVVGLGVGPRLLTDLLGRILADRGLVVTPLTAPGAAGQPADTGADTGADADAGARPVRVDVALVHDAVPADVTAEVVVTLPEAGLAPASTTQVTVQRPGGPLTVEVSDLGELIDLIVDLADDLANNG